ncbi:hypothetical protein E2C01_099985 [Portunus trituberculatus]|uniref:Collagen type XV/XVIII trimerization domain-containing protein n=1 Tax=Portunus trituberculatus TaxID=210409 RepID=A0A5B7KBT3_PORTR|nr:hypothetical protein [Portunus trituberculatus]
MEEINRGIQKTGINVMRSPSIEVYGQTALSTPQMSDMSPVGTLAFLLDEEALLVRITMGWRMVNVSTDTQTLGHEVRLS